jgi:hypothetical protein
MVKLLLKNNGYPDYDSNSFMDLDTAKKIFDIKQF